MRLVYLIQLLFLLLALAYGYRYSLSPRRTVVVAFVWQLAYGLLIYVLFLPEVGLIDVFDVIRLEKELWLPSLIRWISLQVANPITWKYDMTFSLLCQAGGFLVTLSMVLAGSMLHQALHQVRVAELRGDRLGA